MRKCLAVVLLSAVGAVMVAPSAQAGGPTSVLITSPDGGRAAALYYQDGRYTELERVLQTGTVQTGEQSRTGGADYLNLTWLIHDVTIWRTDQVFLDVPGGPLVATRLTLPEDGASDQRVTWRKLSGGSDLRTFMEELGVVGEGQPVASARDVSGEPVSAEPPSVRTVHQTTWASLSGWRWVVPGLLVGLVAGLLIATRSRPDDAPPRSLVDVAPERARLHD